MGKVSLKVLEKFLYCFFKKACEPWNYFTDGLAILVERVVTVAVSSVFGSSDRMAFLVHVFF